MIFRISVNDDKDIIINFLKEYYKEDFYKEYKLNNKTYILKDYFIQIYYNDDYDSILAKIDEDYYLYYKVHLDFIFFKEETDFIVENELKFIEELQQLFTRNNLENELISEYH